jgi:hypothetical protein
VTWEDFLATRDEPAGLWGTEAWLLVIRAVEGGAFADFGIAALFPGGCSVYDELVRLAVRERAEAITGAPADLVDEIFSRLYGWKRR